MTIIEEIMTKKVLNLRKQVQSLSDSNDKLKNEVARLEKILKEEVVPRIAINKIKATKAKETKKTFTVPVASSHQKTLLSVKGKGFNYKVSASDCFWQMVTSLGKKRKIGDDEIQNKNGVYIFWGWNDKPIRIGKSVKVRNRVLAYYSAKSKYQVSMMNKMAHLISYVSVIYTDNDAESYRIELQLIAEFKPMFNKQGK